jgi:hypothetical protein
MTMGKTNRSAVLSATHYLDIRRTELCLEIADALDLCIAPKYTPNGTIWHLTIGTVVHIYRTEARLYDALLLQLGIKPWLNDHTVQNVEDAVREKLKRLRVVRATP